MYDSASESFGQLMLLPRLRNESARDWTSRTLLHNICTIRLPPGYRIRSEQLASAFGLSRTPIHEACLLLEGKGLIEQNSRSCTNISLINMAEVRQFCFVLITSEPWILGSISADSRRNYAPGLMDAIKQIRRARLCYASPAELLDLVHAYRSILHRAAGINDYWQALNIASYAYIRATMIALILEEWHFSSLPFELIFAAIEQPFDSASGAMPTIVRLLTSQLKALEKLANRHPHYFIL